MASNPMLKKVKYMLRFLPDRAYIQLYYFSKFKKFCHLNNPKTFNEKLNWLKLHAPQDPLYTTMVDKYEAKAYVAERIGQEHIIPTLGVWDRFEDIDLDALPKQFVLKCTHDSEGLLIVKDKDTVDWREAGKKLTEALGQNFYHIGREWPYKNVRPRIIAEAYMEDHTDGELRDYKFFCFDGVPKILQVASGRSAGDPRFDYYDMDFRHLDLKKRHQNADHPLRKPETFDQMVQFAGQLSQGFPHLRVDFYEVDGTLYFGELTFYTGSGFSPFNEEKWDELLGQWLHLPGEE